jgi:hypothetical protein
MAEVMKLMEYTDSQQDPPIQTVSVPLQLTLSNVTGSWKFQERITENNRKELQTGTR